MVSPTFENNNTNEFGGMEIYPGGRGGQIDLSDDAIRKIEDGIATPAVPKPVVHSKLFEQLAPEDMAEAKKVLNEFDASTPRPTDLAFDSVPKKLERNTTDVQLEEMALQAFYDGRTDLTIKYFSEIKDREAVREQIETIVEKLVTLKEYEDALKLSNLIFDEASREMEVRHIKAEQAKNAPTFNGEYEEDDDHTDIEDGRRVNINIVRSPEPKVDLTSLNSEGDMEEEKVLPSAIDVAMAKTNSFVEPKGISSEVSPADKNIPTAIELAMKKTDYLVETKAPITPPESPTTSETLSPDVPKDNVESKESVEADLESLRVAREKYATAYTEWEYKTQNSTKLWQKTMFALGASKPAPERLTLRTTELEDAREEYLKAREICGKKSSRTYKENYERATEEKLLLEEAIQQSRENRENSDEQNRKLSDELNQKSPYDKFTEMLGRAKNFWVKDLTPGKRILISSTLLAGGTLFAGAGLGGAAVIGGMRVARAGAGILGAQVTGLGLGKYFENKNATNEELDLKEYAGTIDETNFAEVEAKRLQEFENSMNTKRRQNVAKIGAMATVGGATVLTSGAYFNAATDTSTENFLDKSNPQEVPVKVAVKSVSPEDLTVVDGKTDLISSDLVQEVHSLKADILAHYHDGAVPEAIRKNIIDVPTDKLLEKFHLVDAEHNSSAGSVAGGRILFENGKVVYEQSGISRDLYDPNIEIGQKAYSNVDFGASKGIEIELEPIPAKNVLTGEPLTPLEDIKASEPVINAINHEVNQVGETILEQSFEGGKISVIRGTPGDPNRISMLFDGKEFAVGSIKDGIPKIAVLPELKGGWFTSTIYERAFDAMKSRINPDTLGII